VAAKTCYQCGHRFKRKPLPASFKIAVAVVGVSIVVLGAAAAIVPSLTDSTKALSGPASRLAAGPKSDGDAREAKTEFDNAVLNFLKQNGTLPAAQLTKKLQSALAGPAFEVHVFDLPRGIQVVEVDANLQAMDYLILKNGSNVKVATVTGMEVFESAKIIAQNAAPTLVLLGHTAGQSAHKPLIKVFSLLPDDADDQSAKLVPQIRADGTAAFAKDGPDINLEYSLLSRGQNEHVFAQAATLPAGLPDENIRSSMVWTNGKYELKPSLGAGQLSILYAVAKVLAGTPAGTYSNLLGPAGSQLTANAGDNAPDFTIAAVPNAQPAPGSRRNRNRIRSNPAAVSYVLQGKTSYQVDLGRGEKSGAWNLAGVKKQDGASVAAATATQPTNVTTNGQGQTGQAAGNVNGVVNGGATGNAPSTSDLSNNVRTGTTSGAGSDHAKIVEVTSTAPSKESKSQNQPQPKSSKRPDKITMVPGTAPAPSKSTNVKPDVSPPAPSPKANSSFDWTQREQSTTNESNTPATQIQAPANESHEPAKSSEQPVGIGATVSDKIDAQTVRMRSGPGPNFRQVSTVPRGAKIKVIGKTSGWYKVRVNGQDGYVYGGFLDYSTPDAYNTLTVQKTQRLTDDHNRPLGDAKPGDRMVVLGNTKDGKVRVQLSSGKTAIMNKDAENIQSDQPQFVP
jgi:hypothetical protein